MTTTTDTERRLLVTIEAVERLMRGASEALDGSIEGTQQAKVLLTAAMDHTTNTTCSLVKSLGLSDAIAADARAMIRPVIDEARAVRTATAAIMPVTP